MSANRNRLLVVAFMSLSFPLTSGSDSELKLEGIQGTLFSKALTPTHQVKTLTILSSYVDEIQGTLCPVPFQEIELSSNFRLPKLTSGSFQHCEVLLSLKIIYNQGLEIQKTAFSSLETLQNLEIVGQTVTTLTRDYFQNLGKLQNLTLSSCGLEKIENGAFESLLELTTLGLQGNKISKIEGYLLKLHNLRVLYLDGNNLRKFPWSELQYWPHLEVLSVTYNKISSYDVEKIAKYGHKLKMLSIRYNYFQCKVLKKTVVELLEKIQDLTLDYELREFKYCR